MRRKKVDSELNVILTCYCRSQYLNLSTVSTGILAVFIFWFCPDSGEGGTNIYLVSSSFSFVKDIC